MDPTSKPPPSTPVEPPWDPGELASRRRRRLRQLEVVLAVVVIAVGGLAWVTDGFTRSAGGLLGPQCPPTVVLNGSGSTFVAPLMQTWAAAYAGASASRERGCVVVQPEFNATGAATGLNALATMATQFVATEEPLSPTATASLPAPTVTLPLTAGAVAIVYNLPGAPAGLNISGSVLAGIYLGTITAWDDPTLVAENPGVPLPSATPITVIHETAGSSTSYVLTGFLSAANGTWRTNVGQGSSIAWPTGIAASGDASVAALLAATPGGIAYVGLGTALAEGLPCAKLQGHDGTFVAPSVSSVLAALTAFGGTLPLGNESWANVSLLDLPGPDSYPLATFTYAIVYADIGTAYHGAITLNVAQWLAAFLYWMSVNGQPYGVPVGFAPFSQVFTSANQQIVELLRYDGVPALGDIDYDGD